MLPIRAESLTCEGGYGFLLSLYPSEDPHEAGTQMVTDMGMLEKHPLKGYEL